MMRLKKSLFQHFLSPCRAAIRITLLLNGLLALCLCSAWAQSTFGTMRGTVVDVSGAVIPGATVTVHSLDENFDRTATTSDAGEWVVENLQPGHYSVTVVRAGFAKAVVPSTELDARQDLRVPVTLSVAAQATTVEVSADAAQMNTENGTVADTLSEQNVTELPMNARAVSSSPLATLAVSPSVVTDSQGNIAVGGATSAQVGFSVDGISTANVRSNGALHDAYPSSEGIAETRVTEFNNNAEFAQIGDVTFTTKSGTNQWHGSAFEYFQNDALDANLYDFTSKAPKSFNDFGGSLGGPVVLPWIGSLKDRTFFFADYEGNRRTQSDPEELLVPTAAERSGDLSALVNAPGQGAPVNDPFTGTAYAKNTIPAVSPVAQALLSYYPLPNANGNGYNYQTLVPIPSSTNGWDLRVDDTINAKQSAYARFSWKNLMNSEGGSGLTANQFLPNVVAHDQNRSLLASYNYVIRNNIVNEFRFGFTNFTENDSFPIQGSAAIGDLGLQGINISSHPTGDAFPTFSFSDGSFSTIGQDRTGTTLSDTMEYTDNLTWMIGKHSLKFGVDARHVRYNALMFFQPSDDYGDFIFQPGLFTNYALGDLLLGLPQESFFAITSPQINATSTQWGLYGQDEWQLSSHLTLNFGLRWELLPPFVESRGDLGSFDPAINSVLVPDKFFKGGSTTIANDPTLQTVYTGFMDSFNDCALGNTALACSNVTTASAAHVTQGLRELYKLDLDPRVGIAWRPFNNDKTVVRAGFGIFTQTTLGPMSFNNAGNPTSNLLTNVNAVSGANGGTAMVQPAFEFPQTSPSSATVTLGGGSLEQANDPHFRDPQAAQWNLTLERQITPSTVVRASYVGMSNYRLPVTVDLNQIPASTIPWDTGATAGPFVDKRAPYQNWTLLMSSENYGQSSYEAGVAEVDRKLSRGLLLQANYTWAKNLSDAQGSDAPTVFAGEEAYAVEIANRFDLKSDRGNVVATPRHRALISGTYQLPFGAGRARQGPAPINAIFGGWELSTVTTLQSGDWLTPTTSPAFDQSNTGMAVRAGGGAILRPDCGFGSPYRSTTPGVLFNLGAFAETPAGAGRFGNCGLGMLQGPDMIDVNSGLARNISVHERYKVRFEATFTNVINRSNYAPPQTNISNTTTFGALTAVLPQGLGGNRTGQLALRMDF
ncbi:MAG: carboxypeptidase regulatory-like domain-containing protein [Acidobacteriaceae bacterium]